MQVHQLKLANRFAFDNALHAKEAIYIPTSPSDIPCFAPPTPTGERGRRIRSRTTDHIETYGLPSGLIPTWEWCVHDVAPPKHSSHATAQRPFSESTSAQRAGPLEQGGSADSQFSEIELIIRSRCSQKAGPPTQLPLANLNSQLPP